MEQTNDSISAFSETLQCFFTSIKPASELSVVINAPEYNCTDMRGAIEVAKCLIPDVKMVMVYVGGRKDIVYAIRDGKWIANSYRRKA